MFDIFLNQIASGEIDLNLLKKWLLQREDNIQEINGFKLSRVDFLTCFLNSIHEELPCSSKVVESAPKYPLTSGDVEGDNIIRKQSNLPSTPVKSASYPSAKTEFILDTSTPKVQKTHSDISYASPVSPLYKANCSFSTPTNKCESLDKISICLGDYLVPARPSPRRKTTKHVEKSRRITPTAVNNYLSNDSFKQLSNSFNFNTSEIVKEHYNRDALMEQRFEIKKMNEYGEVRPLSSTRILPKKVNNSCEVEPNIHSVVYNKELDKLAEVYCMILNNRMVLNITSEIYFIISLLLTREPKKVDVESKSCHKYFESVHNIVYFAVKCLESQMEVLKHYDRSVLRLLSDCKRLKLFSPDVCCRLSEISSDKLDRTVDLLEINNHTNICFNLDTDNRDNFPSDVSFHAFRKQRDLFYEILRIWENSHLNPNWNFSLACAGKIKSLLSLSTEPVNFVHLSRLFKAQLINHCGKSVKDEGLIEEHLPSLPTFPNVDADKLNRLKNRLVTKQPSSGLNSPPLFTGYQEFYKDFIVVASSHIFNKHLTDIFIAEIVELNDTKFMNVESSDSAVDATTKKSFLTCVRHLRLLAKFLGFIQTIPYKPEATYSEHLVATQIKIRQQQLPSLDVRCLLKKSVENRDLVLTIPWVTKYFSMLDYITLRLPYCLSCYKILFWIYRNCNMHTKGFNYNSALISSCLGWLFELPRFPDTEYLAFCLNGSDNFQSLHSNIVGVDDISMVDQDILYAFCPYLEEIKTLLSSTSSNRGVTIKHITPVSAELSVEDVQKRKLEHQLEESFLNTQPISMRKTIEFVSERIASACIKHICSEIVPSYRKKALDSFKEFLDEWKKEQKVSNANFDDSQKLALKSLVPHKLHEHLGILRQECSREATRIMKEKVQSSIENLLAIDTLPETTTACVALTAKMCKDRVKQWMTSQLNTGIFAKDFNGEVQKLLDQDNNNKKDKPVFALPSGGQTKEHNEDCISAAHLLEKIRVLSVDIVQNSKEVSKEYVTELIHDSLRTMNERCDVNETIAASICTSLVDVSLLLTVHRSDIMPDIDLILSLISVWKCYYKNIDNLFKNMLCPRNVILIAQACNDAVVWSNFSKFIAILVKEKVISCGTFETQCIGLFRRDWDEGTLTNFSLFLKKFMEYHRSFGGDADKFALLLEFLSDYCEHL